MLKKIYNFTIAILVFQMFICEANSQVIPDENILKTPILSFKGFSNSSFAVRNQNSSFEQKKLPDAFTDNRYNGRYGANNSSQFNLKAEAKTSLNVKYGIAARLETEFFSDQNRGRVDIDQAFIFADSSYGKFEFGNIVAVNQKMKVGPASFAKGNGGINGNYLKYVNLPMLNNIANNSNIKLPSFILVAQSPIGHGGYAQGFYNDNFNKNRLRTLRNGSFNESEDAVKINYYSPRIEGLQIGASYTRDTSSSGVATTIFGNNSTTVNDVFSFGANYSGDIDNIGYAVSATAENGTVKQYQGSLDRNNLSSYDLATTISYFGFSLGASYGSWGDSLQTKNNQGIYSCDYNSGLALSSQNCSTNSQKFKNASYYTLGAAYEFGPVGISVTNLKSTFQKNEYKATSLDIDYKLKRDLIPYFEITKFEFKSNQVQAFDIFTNQLQDNKGFVALVGFLFSF